MAHSPLFLKFGNIDIAMTPVINHPTKNDPVYSDTHVEGDIMNAGSIQATIHAPLREDNYNIKGSIKSLELTKLNSSAENLGKFYIESGFLTGWIFILPQQKRKLREGL